MAELAFAEVPMQISLSGPALSPGAGLRYLISGLSVVSDIELPSASPLVATGATPDVVFRAGRVAEHLPCAEAEGLDWELAGDTFLLRVAGVGRFQVQNGASVQYEQYREADPGDTTLYLLGTCLAILLQQRGDVVLHASAVAVGQGAVLFCGPSGAGKSTLAALLCERGYPLLNDDTCCLRPDATGALAVAGDGRKLKLWAKSLDHLALWNSPVTPVRKDTAKYYVAPPQSDLVTRRVSAIYQLQVVASHASPSIHQLSPISAITSLRENVYRSALVQAMNLESTYFQASVRLQSQARIMVLSRPMDFTQVDSVLDLLEEDWRKASLLVGSTRAQVVQSKETR